MSNFNLDLERARKRRSRFYLLIGGLGVLGSLAVLVPLFLVNGTFIKILPDEASKTAEFRVTSGPAMTIGNKVYSFSGPVGLEIKARGYLPVDLDLVQQEKTNFVEVRLVEAPGHLNATAIPASETTNWYLNDKFATTGANLSVELKAGEYELEANDRFHQKQTLKVGITKGHQTDLTVELKPIDGLLKLSSDPSGALVKLNDQPVGVTPTQVELAGGSYSVKLAHPDRKALTDTVEVTNDRPVVERAYRLLHQDAFVRFSLEPAGGLLLLNGQHLGAADRVRVDALKPHVVTYLKDGFLAQTQEIELKPLEERKLNFSLKMELGQVEISSNPPGLVSIDGKARGETPLAIDLPAINHKIVISKPGYRSHTQELMPSGKAVKRITVNLQTELQARLAETPETYKNAIGLTMRLFKPGQFTMGAPRSEKGQRANEFQRRVRLTKPFYVSTHEVTVGQFSKFRPTKPDRANPELPVTNVDWLDAVKFCNWLSRKEGLEQFYRVDGGRYRGENKQADGYRLPTEAEWEWLARMAGRAQTSRFSWGDQYVIPPSTGNFADESTKGMVKVYIPNYDDGYPQIAPVGSFKPDKAGLFDMAGNVSEWVHDFYSLRPPKADKLEVDPFGPSFGDSRVIKGSNWRSGSLTELRAAFREGLIEARDDVGFRVVRYVYGKADATN